MNHLDVSARQRAEDERDERYRQQATDEHRERRDRAAADSYLIGQLQDWLGALLREQARESARRQALAVAVPYVPGSLRDPSILAVEIENAIAKVRASIAACRERQ